VVRGIGEDRSVRLARILPWLAGAIVLALAVFSIVLNALAGDDGQSWLAVAVFGVGILASLGVGVLVSVRLPEQPLGWVLLANAVVISVAGVTDSYGRYAALAHPGALPGGDWAALCSDASWPLLFAGVVAIAYLFPDGRLPSARWRPMAWIGIASFVLMQAIAPFNPEAFSAPFESVSSPLGSLPSSVYGPASGLFLLGLAATLIGGVLALRSRFRRSTGIERLQIKWLLLAALVIPATLIACILEGLLTGDVGVVTLIGVAAIQFAIPAAIGVAVLRYRLFEIDRLISVTLAYLVLTALLALGFAAVSVALGVALGGGSTLPTAAATLAVVLAFRPLGAWVQSWVDRRFNRARYEGLKLVADFLTELRLGRVEPEDTGRMLAAALSDPTLTLFFWLPREGFHADAGGRPVPELPTAPAGRTPVRRGDLQLGTLVHDPALLDRSTLLEDVITRAGLAIEIARLRVEVRGQLSEVEQSRARIVAAGYEERRRVERDLHDGAQQRLVSIGLDLRHLQHELGDGSEEARATLDAVVVALGEAIEELRELARGVRPSALDEGLAPALRELAVRSAVRTEVEATDERFSEPVEAAAYFVASEALTNSVKHAGASRVLMSATRSNGTLTVEVSDDGRGGAAPAAGSGLAGLVDRVAALGGRLDISSTQGSGTRLVAELPCE
jgi:signal transduction histidine kinase